MGKKVNPVGFRVGIYKNWSSIWFAEKKNLAINVLEDRNIRNFLIKRLNKAGIEKVEIQRSIANVKIVLSVSRPGMVIGRGGSELESLKEELKKLTTSKIELEVLEVKDFETSATLVAKNIASQIERRIHYRRAVKSSVKKAMDKGALGIKIQASGLLGGASSIARTEKYSEGSVPTQTLRANIDYAEFQAKPAYGSIGIKVWIHKKQES